MGTYRGLKISKATTNLVPLSRTSKTKTIAVVSGTVYTASARGKGGSFVLSGAATGTVTDGNPVTFTASSNSLTLTVTGYLKHMQVEPGPIATQEVWTRNTALTKPADAPSPMIALQIGRKLGADEGAIVISLSKLVGDTSPALFLTLLSQGSTSAQNSIKLSVNNSGIITTEVTSGSVVRNTTTHIGNSFLNGGTLGLSWKSGVLKIFKNGSLISTVTDTLPAAIDKLYFGTDGYEAIYKGIFFFATAPIDSNMVLATNF